MADRLLSAPQLAPGYDKLTECDSFCGAEHQIVRAGVNTGSGKHSSARNVADDPGVVSVLLPASHSCPPARTQCSSSPALPLPGFYWSRLPPSVLRNQPQPHALLSSWSMISIRCRTRWCSTASAAA